MDTSGEKDLAMFFQISKSLSKYMEFLGIENCKGSSANDALCWVLSSTQKESQEKISVYNTQITYPAVQRKDFPLHPFRRWVKQHDHPD
jgi:hypothetical protein